MKSSAVALRMQTSLLEEVRRVAERERVTLDHLINVAVAEKLSALRTAEYFRERAARGSLRKAKAVLRRAGKGKLVVEGGCALEQRVIDRLKTALV